MLHGNLHNQSAWLPLAAFLHSNKYLGPIFTVNLPSYDVTDTDRAIIEHKLNEIKQLYVEKNMFDVNITLIGHSRGAGLAYNRFFYPESFVLENTQNTYESYDISEENAPVDVATPVTVNKVILMGCSNNNLSQYPGCFFISARHDILAPPLENTQDTVVDTGHLGVIANPEALERCYEILTM